MRNSDKLMILPMFAVGLCLGEYDIAFDQGRLAKSVVYWNFDQACTSPSTGPHKIAFDAKAANLGPDDFDITTPSHDYFTAKVYDMNGNHLTTSTKQMSCPTDVEAISWVTPNAQGHGCDGMSPGYADVYRATYTCNWADFGNVATGADYSIWAELNPSHSWESFTPSSSEKDFDNHKVWVTGNFVAAPGNARAFNVRTSLSVGSKSLTAGKKVFYGVHPLNGLGSGIITINGGSDYALNSGVSELGMYAHKVQVTNSGGAQALVQISGGSKFNVRVLGIEQY